MNINIKQHAFALLGEVLTAALMSAGLTLLLADSSGQFVSAAYIYSCAGLACAVLFGLSYTKASGWITFIMLISAALVAVLFGWKPLERLRLITDALRNREGLDAYINEFALAAMLLLLVASYIIAHQPGGVYLMLFACVCALAIGWFFGAPTTSIHILPVICALSAMFAKTGFGSVTHLRPLVSLSLVSALLACLLVPAEGIKSAYLSNAAEEALEFMIRTFNIENNNLEERRAYTISSSGWLSRRDIFSGPAHPSNEELMRVETDETAYLRGSIRYIYNTRAWVDEDNAGKAGKIKRYMLGGIEGRIYRSEYERTFDMDKSASSRFFEPSRIYVETLLDNPYWSLYAPNRTTQVRAADDVNVYFNNVGELFINRPLRAGDDYTIEYRSLALSEGELEKAISDCEGDNDDAYAYALLLNRDLPVGIEQELYSLTYDITRNAETPYQKAAAIRDWLTENGSYTLDADYVPDGRDMVSYFVLDSLKGYCVYYASAMALMARIAGLPARYVEGYLAVPNDDGSCVLTGENAHAWAEVYFKGFGWVTFDATPSRENEHQEQTENPPEPTPTPTPQPEEQNEPTPTPTPSDTQNEPTPTPTPTPPPPESGNSPNAPEQQPENQPPETNTENDNNRNSGSGWIAALIILLIMLLLALLVLFVRMRLINTRPNEIAKKLSNDEDKLMCWYRAMLTALSASGIVYATGETPAAFAERALASNACGDEFVMFSAEVAYLQYSESSADKRVYALAESAYSGIVKRLKVKNRLRWLSVRALKGIGKLRPIP